MQYILAIKFSIRAFISSSIAVFAETLYKVMSPLVEITPLLTRNEVKYTCGAGVAPVCGALPLQSQGAGVGGGLQAPV